MPKARDAKAASTQLVTRIGCAVTRGDKLPTQPEILAWLQDGAKLTEKDWCGNNAVSQALCHGSAVRLLDLFLKQKPLEVQQVFRAKPRDIFHIKGNGGLASRFATEAAVLHVLLKHADIWDRRGANAAAAASSEDLNQLVLQFLSLQQFDAATRMLELQVPAECAWTSILEALLTVNTEEKLLNILGALQPAAPAHVPADALRLLLDRTARRVRPGQMEWSRAYEILLGWDTDAPDDRVLIALEKLGRLPATIPVDSVLLARDKNGRSALHSMARHDKVEMVQILIDAGADLQQRDNRRRTPLHVAAMWGAVSSIIRLVFAGASLDARNDLDQTPSKEITSMHSLHGRAGDWPVADIDSLLSACSLTRPLMRFNEFANLLARKIDEPRFVLPVLSEWARLAPDTRLVDSIPSGSPLVVAALKWNTSELRKLLEYRPALDWPPHAGQQGSSSTSSPLRATPPLVLAIDDVVQDSDGADIDKVLALLQSGANVFATDFLSGRTPLESAVCGAVPFILRGIRAETDDVVSQLINALAQYGDFSGAQHATLRARVMTLAVALRLKESCRALSQMAGFENVLSDAHTLGPDVCATPLQIAALTWWPAGVRFFTDATDPIKPDWTPIADAQLFDLAELAASSPAKMDAIREAVVNPASGDLLAGIYDIAGVSPARERLLTPNDTDETQRLIADSRTRHAQLQERNSALAAPNLRDEQETGLKKDLRILKKKMRKCEEYEQKRVDELNADQQKVVDNKSALAEEIEAIQAQIESLPKRPTPGEQRALLISPSPSASRSTSHVSFQSITSSDDGGQTSADVGMQAIGNAIPPRPEGMPYPNFDAPDWTTNMSDLYIVDWNGRRYVLKTWRQQGTRQESKEKQLSDTLEREMKIHMQLRATTILPLHCCFIDKHRDVNKLWLCTEFQGKGNLKELIEQKGPKLALSYKLALITDLADALAYLASVRIGGARSVHRDLNPDNVLISDGGRALLSDFGVAKMFDKTRVGTVQNHESETAKYSAPELLNDAPINERIDIFSFSYTAFFILAEEHPFKGKKVMKVLADIGRELDDESRSVRPDLTCIHGIRPQPNGSLHFEIRQLEHVRDMLVNCWKSNPRQRWPAQRLAREMRNFNLTSPLLWSKARVFQTLRQFGELLEQDNPLCPTFARVNHLADEAQAEWRRDIDPTLPQFLPWNLPQTAPPRSTHGDGGFSGLDRRSFASMLKAISLIRHRFDREVMGTRYKLTADDVPTILHPEVFDQCWPHMGWMMQVADRLWMREACDTYAGLDRS